MASTLRVRDEQGVESNRDVYVAHLSETITKRNCYSSCDKLLAHTAIDSVKISQASQHRNHGLESLLNSRFGTPTTICHSLNIENHFCLFIRNACQTKPVSVERVSTTAADGVPRGMVVRSQTIDVYGFPAISSGGFRLTYGDNDPSIVTPCIPADLTNLTAEAVSVALSSANAFLNVTVEEDHPPFDGVKRFVVHFHEPQIGLEVLGIAAEDDACKWIECSPSEGDGGGEIDEGDSGSCDDSGVLINRDKSVFLGEGALEVCGLSYTEVEYCG